MDTEPALPEQGPPSAGFFVPEQTSISPAAMKLATLSASLNAAEDIDDEELDRIGRLVIEEFEFDEQSRSEWMAENKEHIDLAKQLRQKKNTPWEGAANIKLPLITDAAVKFSARAYGEIIRGDDIVKARIVGEDPDGSKKERAERVSRHMSWQHSIQMEEWEADTDRLLIVLSVAGTLFRKTYWCPIRRRKRSELCLPDKVVVNNQASDITDCRRISHILELHRNDVVESQRAGIFLDVDLEKDHLEKAAETEEYFECIEQQRWLDLDGDGYEEPYIVTVHKQSKKVLRIKAAYDLEDVTFSDSEKVQRIDPQTFFTDFHFIPSVDGSFYSTGFGRLLGPMNDAANTVVNMLLDAGALSNLQSGFLSKEIRIRGGNTRFKPGEWKKTDKQGADLRNSIHPLPTREPSGVLFSLLGLFIDQAKDLAGTTDVLSGESAGANMSPTTVQALIEQGMKVYNAIYKRIYRSLTREYRIGYKLNFMYMDEQEYYAVNDSQKVAYKKDYAGDDYDVVPVSDPNLSSDMQRIAQAQALMEIRGEQGVDRREILHRYVVAVKADNPDALVPEVDPSQATPEQLAMEKELQEKSAEIKLKAGELNIKEQEMQIKAMELARKKFETLVKAIETIANAEAAEPGEQIGQYRAIVSELLNDAEGITNDEGRLRSMGEPAHNSSGAEAPGGNPPIADGAALQQGQ